MSAPTIDQLTNQVRGAAIDSLRSEICPGCDGSKRTRKALCRSCWSQLPQGMRADLYQGIGQGYELALSEAIKLIRGSEI